MLYHLLVKTKASPPLAPKGPPNTCNSPILISGPFEGRNAPWKEQSTQSEMGTGCVLTSQEGGRTGVTETHFPLRLPHSHQEVLRKRLVQRPWDSAPSIWLGPQVCLGEVLCLILYQPQGPFWSIRGDAQWAALAG